MNQESPYPIGTPGKKWGQTEINAWSAMQTIKRHYADEVLAKIEKLKASFAVEKYGALSCDPERYPLFVVKTKDWKDDLPNVLITGGVHGYETSGVQGALRFLKNDAREFESKFNFLVAPCLSPWGYETINRWNPLAVDPNRSFRTESPSEEASFILHHLRACSIQFLAHFDLHETTDTDNTEFRPALASRDAVDQDHWDIPDGFYTVGDCAKSTPEFQAAIIKSVESLTHIAPPTDGKIIGEPLEQWGVIHYDAGPLGLCMGMTKAPFVTTTEVYPDSPQVDDENCIAAQVAAVTGGLNYLQDKEK